MKGLFSKILIPVDGSRYSLNAVRLGGRMALFHGAEVFLLHVVDSEVLEQLCRADKGRCAEIEAEMEAEARGLLEDMGRELTGLGIADAESLLKKGVPYDVILDVADELGIDLIVMGKLGRRGIKRILLGSVAERVIEFSRCPVLLSDGQG